MNPHHAPDKSHTKPILLLGAGGHARVLLALLHAIGRPVHAILDDDPATHGQTLGPTRARVEAGLDQLHQHTPDTVELVNAIGSAHHPAARRRVFETWTTLGYRFATLQHPAAIVDPHATLDQGAQVMAGATLQTGVHIQANALINSCASIDHDTRIGPHSHVAPGVTICGDVRVGSTCHIGAGATLIQCITVGDDAVIGAGATVLSDVAPAATVVGCPAKPIRRSR